MFFCRTGKKRTEFSAKKTGIKAFFRRSRKKNTEFSAREAGIKGEGFSAVEV